MTSIGTGTSTSTGTWAPSSLSSRCPRCGATGRVQWQDPDDGMRTRKECMRCEREDVGYYVRTYGELPPGVEVAPTTTVIDLLNRPLG
jgi:hypothetical protein